MSYYIGTDIGGTFTECVVMDDPDGKTRPAALLLSAFLLFFLRLGI